MTCRHQNSRFVMCSRILFWTLTRIYQQTDGYTFCYFEVPLHIRSSKTCVKLCPFVLIQVAVCNLGSLALNMYVRPDKTYDFDRLQEVTKVVVRNLNKIIDINYYPVPEVISLNYVSVITQYSVIYN